MSVFDLAAQLEIPEASSAGERTPCADEAAPPGPDRATHRAQLQDGDAKDPEADTDTETENLPAIEPEA